MPRGILRAGIFGQHCGLSGQLDREASRSSIGRASICCGGASGASACPPAGRFGSCVHYASLGTTRASSCDCATSSVRAFAIIQKDMLEVFDFVEPADRNLSCYSYRIHELFIRTCIEIEANFKAILAENGYVQSGDWNMTDYRKTEASHLLSAYLVKFPVWQGSQHTRQPFGHLGAEWRASVVSGLQCSQAQPTWEF
jgi:hypothetical protein